AVPGGDAGPAGRRAVGRAAAQARAGRADGRGARPAGAGRTDQPSVARPGGGAGGGSRPLSRGAGDRHARPGTAGPLPRDGTGTHGRTRILIKMTQGAPYGVATGADGALWFTLTEPGAIGRLVPGEEPVVHRLDPADGGPTVIAPGPDGAMWFTEFRGNRVGRITPDSEVTSYEAESPYGIVAG